MKYISLDTETGGIGEDLSLLSVALIVIDGKNIRDGLVNEFDYVDVFNSLLRPDDGVFKVTAEALRINRIDISTLDRETSLTYKEAGSAIYNFLHKLSDHGREKLIPLGKNIYFDLGHIWDKLISRRTWEQFCSYRTIDLSALVETYRLQEKLPPTLDGSLKTVARYFDINIDKCHTALGDAQLNIDVFSQLVRL